MKKWNTRKTKKNAKVKNKTDGISDGKSDQLSSTGFTVDLARPIM